MKRNIVFYGEAAKKYGKKHTVDADTLFMVFRGLAHILGAEFKQYVKGLHWHIYKNSKKSPNNAMSELQIGNELGAVETLHVVPAIVGASGATRVIVGVALMVAAWYFDQPQWAMQAAAMITLSGVAAMLAPKTSTGSSAQSFNFSGPNNNTAQGGPVPIVYGKVGNIGGTLISAGITYERI